MAVNDTTDWEAVGQQGTLAETAADMLRSRIVSGSLQPGEHLVEVEIARRLGISRGPVREAMMKLRAEGLLREEPRRGSFVMELTLRDIREIYDLRAAIEAHAARRIIQHADQDALTRLSELVTELRAAAAGNDREAFARLDLAFHEELTRRSGNSRLHRCFITHTGLLGTLLRLEVTTQYESLDGLLHEHEQLLDDLLSKDVQCAEAACYLHLEQAADRVVRMCELRES